MTLEQFIAMAARGTRLTRLRCGACTVLAAVVPVPALRGRLRNVRDRDRSLLDGVKRFRAIYAEMTPAERDDPSLVNHGRRAAIASAAGVEPMDVSQLLRGFRSANRAQAILNKAEQRHWS